MLRLFKKIKELHARFKAWKPIHLCWWFEKHGLPIPPYLIGGGAYFDEVDRVIMNDDPSTTDDPSSCSYYGSSPIDVEQGTKFHIRFVVQETGGKGETATLVFYYNTSVDPSGGWQITTAVDTAPIRIADSTGGQPLADSIDAGFWDNWSGMYGTSGEDWYIDTSDTFPTAQWPSSDGHCEFQACLELTGHAVPGQQYCVFMRFSDGTMLDAYTATVAINALAGTKTTSANTSWQIKDYTQVETAWDIFATLRTTEETTWTIFNSVTREIAWKRYLPLDTEWTILKQTSRNLTWQIGQYKLPTEWTIQKGTELQTSWDIGRYELQTSWAILNATFDVEWQEADTLIQVGLVTDIHAEDFTLTDLAPNTNYRWRARVHDIDGAGTPGTWSYWKTFTSELLTLSLFWKIKNTKSQDTSYALCALSDMDTEWEIDKLIAVPVNLQTTNIESTTAQFSWSMP